MASPNYCGRHHSEIEIIGPRSQARWTLRPSMVAYAALALHVLAGPNDIGPTGALEHVKAIRVWKRKQQHHDVLTWLLLRRDFFMNLPYNRKRCLCNG